MGNNYRGGIIENIRIAGRTENMYGVCVALGYFLPIWSVMVVIGIFNVNGLPENPIFWIFYSLVFLVVVVNCRALINWSLKNGKEATQIYQSEIGYRTKRIKSMSDPE